MVLPTISNARATTSSGDAPGLGSGVAAIGVVGINSKSTSFSARWERNSVDEAPQQKFGPKPEMLLELRAGPYHHVRDAQFHGGRSNLIATLGRDTAAAYELEGVRFAGHRVHRRGHILLRLRLGQAATIDALNDGALVRLVVERTCADDVTPLVASRLAEPREIGPACTKVKGEHKALKLGPAKILEMNGPDGSRYRHLPTFWLPELRSGLMI